MLKSLGYALGLGALVVGTMTVACGAGPTPADDVGDPWAVHASGQTRSALGVQTWGYRMVTPGTVSVRGYDADKRSVVEVRQRVIEVDASHWIIDFGVARESGTSALRFALEATPTDKGAQVRGTPVVDTLSADMTARQILARLREDSRSRGTGSTSQAITVGTNSLSPTDLTHGGDGDLSKGGDNLVDGGDGGYVNGGNGGNGDNNGNNGNDQSCQSSDQCGGNMMDSLQPMLGMLSALGQGVQAFAGVYQCMQEDAGAGDLGNGNVQIGPVVLPKLAVCLFQQVMDSQGGGDSQGAGGSQGGGGGVEQLSQLLSVFTSMGSMGQNCNCPK